MESRQSRMQKYYEPQKPTENEKEISNFSSRTKRNRELYKEVSNAELEAFDLNSNVSVIGENTETISLDDIKDILSEKYRQNPRKKSFGDTDEIDLPKINLDETREYDINSILAKAREKKEVNYETDRLKKVRDTQYDILKDLDIINNEEEIEENDDIEEKPTDRRVAPNREKEEKKLHDLIDTIAAKELIDNESNLEVTGEMDPLDILSDLRGDDENTKVMGALVQEVQKQVETDNEEIDEFNEDTLGIVPLEPEKEETESPENKDEKHYFTADWSNEYTSKKNKIKEEFFKEMEEQDDSGIEEIDEQVETEHDASEKKSLENEEKSEKEEKQEKKKAAKKEKKEKKNKKIENSFIGATTAFTQSDFDDFKDLKDDMKISKIILKILIVVIILVFILGCVLLANNFLGLGLF